MSRLARAYLRAMGFSRLKICRDTGLHNSTVRHLMQGNLRRMNRKTKHVLAEYIGCDPKDLEDETT